MTRFTHRLPPLSPAAPDRQPSGRTKRLLLVAVSIAILVTAASCSSNGDGASSDPTPSVETPATDNSANGTAGDSEADSGKLPEACDVIVLEDWEAITALELVVPEQDTALAFGSGTICGVAADGTDFPYLFIVQITPLGSPGSVENLAVFLDDYEGMEEVDGIGDRALYWDQDTTYQGDAVADHPMVAFEAGAANVTITLDADSLGRAELEQLAKAVADKI